LTVDSILRCLKITPENVTPIFIADPIVVIFEEVKLMYMVKLESKVDKIG